jgi:protein import protein ZIM17
MRPSPSLMRCLCRTSTSSVRPSVRATKHIPQPRPQTPQPSFLIRPQLAISKRHAIPSGIRYESTSATPAPPLSSTTKAPQSRLDRDQVPAYELTFTCKKCTTRSSHRVSKQGYHHGTVLITCPGCKNRHLISDHLKVRLCQPAIVPDH